jgi:hypothetical protein
MKDDEKEHGEEGEGREGEMEEEEEEEKEDLPSPLTALQEFITEEAEEARKEREQDEKSLHVEFVLDMSIDSAGGELLSAAQLKKRRRKQQRENGGEELERPEETEGAGGEVEQRRMEKQHKFCEGLLKEIADAMDGDERKMRVLSLQAGSVIARIQMLEGVCVDLPDVNDVMEQLHDIVAQLLAPEGKQLARQARLFYLFIYKYPI